MLGAPLAPSPSKGLAHVGQAFCFSGSLDKIMGRVI